MPDSRFTTVHLAWHVPQCAPAWPHHCCVLVNISSRCTQKWHMRTMVNMFQLAVVHIFKISCGLIHLSAHTPFLSMTTNMKFPLFVPAVNNI